MTDTIQPIQVLNALEFNRNKKNINCISLHANDQNENYDNNITPECITFSATYVDDNIPRKRYNFITAEGLTFTLTNEENGALCTNGIKNDIDTGTLRLYHNGTPHASYIPTIELAAPLIHVTKSLQVDEQITTPSIIIDGICEATTFVATSDMRKKTNIQPFKYEKSILNLPIYSFNYIHNDMHSIGCLAQDLQQLYPELVHTDAEGFLSINESKLIYLLLCELNKIVHINNLQT